MTLSSSKIWSLDHQLEFARISGDFNPMHIDPVKARRCIFGKAVVHGIHLVLWALDHSFSVIQKKGKLKKIRAVFNKPAGINELITLSVKDIDGSPVSISLKSEGVPITEISFEWEESDFNQNSAYNFQSPFEERAPREMNVPEFSGFKDELEVRTDISKVKRLFPALSLYIPWEQIATILMTTQIVGMECPGLNSIFNELELDFEQSEDTKNKIRYQVSFFHESFHLVKIQIDSSQAKGHLKAFVRPSLAENLSLDDLSKKIVKDEFKDQRALIVGGSRGLGEITAKILSLGGAQVHVTYFKGKNEVSAVAEKLKEKDGWFNSSEFDVSSSNSNIADTLQPGWTPTHLYYFATPFIFDGTKKIFSEKLFEKFCAYYVSGFWRIFDGLRPLKSVKVIVYPSSSALEELPGNMFEYSLAKAAGETLCAYMRKHFPELKVLSPRFERLATDQTLSIMPVENKDPIPVILDLLRNQMK